MADTTDFAPYEPASLVHERYPHNGVRHALVPGSEATDWYEHTLPNGRIGACVWLYDSDHDKRSRTIVVREWNNPTGEVYVRGGVHLGAQCSHVTNQFLDKLAALPPVNNQP
jgi:hypothetical protein